jgi:uncharacterized protein (TIGR02118 family)
MIHQLIFAAPKPGMTEAEFQKYWVEVHAVKYASKIPQIKKYMIDTRIPLPGEKGDGLFSGLAEIWLENDKESIESLQTKEFLQGARADEPNWAAFWKTLVLEADADAHVLLKGPELAKGQTWIKYITILKRKEGMKLADFRAYSLGKHAELGLKIPGLLRCMQCHTRDSWYGFGEPRFDCVNMQWFDSVDALVKAQNSAEYKKAGDDLKNFVEMKYFFPVMAAKEHWIIGPKAR